MIIMVGVLVFAISMDWILSNKENKQAEQLVFEEYGVVVKGQEAKCFNFCEGSEYLFEPSTGVRAMVCQCKND